MASKSSPKWEASILRLLFSVHVDRVIPVDDVMRAVGDPQVLTQILGAVFRCLQVAIVAGHHVRGGESVDQARDGVGFLAEVVRAGSV